MVARPDSRRCAAAFLLAFLACGGHVNGTGTRPGGSPSAGDADTGNTDTDSGDQRDATALASVDGQTRSQACIPRLGYCDSTPSSCCAGLTCNSGVYTNQTRCLTNCTRDSDCAPTECCGNWHSQLLCFPADLCGDQGCIAGCPNGLCQYQTCCSPSGTACAYDGDCCFPDGGGEQLCAMGRCR